jgi:hypothetical protein
MPVQPELFLLAPFTGLMAMLGYEAIRWLCIGRWNATKKRYWKAINEWIEVKPAVSTQAPADHFDPTTLTDKTEPKP